MAKQHKPVTIPDAVFQTLDFLDKKFREHKYLSQVMNEEMIRTQAAVLKAENPEMFEQMVKGFIRLDIDWKHKQLVIIPTNVPEKKAEEVAETLKNHHAKNSN